MHAKNLYNDPTVDFVRRAQPACSIHDADGAVYRATFCRCDRYRVTKNTSSRRTERVKAYVSALLFVISRTSSTRYRGEALDCPFECSSCFITRIPNERYRTADRWNNIFRYKTLDVFSTSFKSKIIDIYVNCVDTKNTRYCLRTRCNVYWWSWTHSHYTFHDFA